MTFKTPDTFYLVAVDFRHAGFGSAGDITADWDDACEQFADQTADDEPARIFRIEMDADNQPASIADVTADAVEVARSRLSSRGYDEAEISELMGAA